MDASPQVETTRALPIGTQLGEFELRQVLAEGGFGIVYLAFDKLLQRDIAIKEFFPATLAARSPGGHDVELLDARHAETFALALRSFVNEARLLARFDHPSLVKVYRYWEQHGTAYMVMPVYRGPTLKEARAAMAEPPYEAWLRAMLAPLLDALEVLHDEAVYHRDIAPDNIMLGPGDRPVLLDFGAARRVIGDMSQSLTVMLKPGYAPIEQYAEVPGMRQGAWTDLYALGATLHYLLLGKPPAPCVARMVHDDQAPLATQALPGCSEAFLRIVDSMLAVRPEDRPQSVRDLRARLDGESLWFGSPTSAPAPSMPAAPAHDASGVAAPARDPFADLDSPPPPPFPPAPAPGRPRGLWGWLAGLFGGTAASSPPQPSQAPAARRRHANAPTPSPGPAPSLSVAPAHELMRMDRTIIVPSQPRPPMDVTPPDRTVLLTATPAARDALATLTVVRSDLPSFVGRRFPIQEQLLIGRDPAGDITLPDPEWSRQHATLRRTPQGFEVVDAGSTNGTHVNGLRIAPQRAYALHPGATLRVGSTHFVLAIESDESLAELEGVEIAGRYRLQACLQASPKGALYRAEKATSGVRVAIKLLSPAYASYAGYRQRFETEARVAASLQHPHVCGLDDYGEAELTLGGRPVRVPFLSYPIMAGGNLADRLSGMADVDSTVIAGWIAQLGQALQHAHDHGVVHGNLKPTAICFDEAFNAYVTDFAIASGASPEQALLGTPAYMAPEQWDGHPPNPASDQYALAVLAYLMLSGSRPYEGQEDPATRARNLQRPPAALHAEAAARGPRKLNVLCTQVVERALARAPDDRHASIAEFAQALAQALRAGDRVKPGAQVFFSYRREVSAGWVTHLAELLKRDHEIRCFVDTQGLDGAGKFPVRIRQAIEHCSVFVCMLGPGTLDSRHVRDEIAIAHEHGKPMIPVFQEGFVAPDPAEADAATTELLQYDGVVLLDRQNLYVQSAVGELARHIRLTLGDVPGPRETEQGAAQAARRRDH